MPRAARVLTGPALRQLTRIFLGPCISTSPSFTVTKNIWATLGKEATRPVGEELHTRSAASTREQLSSDALAALMTR